MAKYEVTKAEAVPRQEALAGWPGNHKECGPPFENTQTIVSGPYPDVSSAHFTVRLCFMTGSQGGMDGHLP